MDELRARLQFSETFPKSARAEIRQQFADEGIGAEVAERDLSFKGATAAPESLVIYLTVSVPLLQFLKGYSSAAGADAWAATKRIFKRVRTDHVGGQEVHIADENGDVHARYILPSDPLQLGIAIDAISDDFSRLEKSEERWWLGPPDTRWGTGLERAERGTA